MLEKKVSTVSSKYIELYDIIIPQNNMLRKINELIDFSFVYNELKEKYSNIGRVAINPIRMFKYLLLKSIFDISDVDVVERSKYDMSFKYFLEMAPEDDVIDPSSLTKFRKLRLQDINLLDLLINKTVTLALEKKIIKSKSIIVDSTHTKSRYNQKSQKDILVETSKKLRKAIYQIDVNYKEKFPQKPKTNILNDQLDYCKNLLSVVEADDSIKIYQNVKEKLNLLKEIVEDNIEELKTSFDQDAKIGHKSVDTSFFGYKTHIAMTGERIITSVVLTTGEKNDGKELIKLIEKSQANGIEVEDVIGDAAYSEKNNIDYATNNNINLVSRLSKSTTHGNRKNEDKFEFNKDAEMYVCKDGHMAIRKARQGKKNQGSNQSETYYFDINKCKICSKKEGCYKDGAKSKTYAVTIKSPTHKKQIEFQKTEYFKEKAKERYKIEAKNSELKHRHGYDVASSSGLIGMHLQSAVTIFTVNLKRIMKLMDN